MVFTTRRSAHFTTCLTRSRHGQDIAPLNTAEPERAVEYKTSYRSIRVDGVSIFYREAGPKDAPTILLLHGLPSSSRMFEPLFARLADRFHLAAPDYPGL